MNLSMKAYQYWVYCSCTIAQVNLLVHEICTPHALLHLHKIMMRSACGCCMQLLAEKGELPTRFGSATLGILLLQVINRSPLSHSFFPKRSLLMIFFQRVYSVLIPVCILLIHRILPLFLSWSYSLF